MTTGQFDDMMVRWFGASWRTSFAGGLTVALSVLLIFAEDLGIGVGMAQKLTSAVMLLTGGGLMVARDNRVSSEKAGAIIPPLPRDPTLAELDDAIAFLEARRHSMSNPPKERP